MMIATVRLLAATCLLWGIATEAAAIFDVQLLVGRRTGSWEQSGGTSKDSTADEIRAGFHLDPIPLVPISFGVGYEVDTYKNPGDFGMGELSSQSLQPEISAWLPVGNIKPYMRLGYALTKFTGTSVTNIGGVNFTQDISMSSSGLHLGFGALISLVPSLALMLEYSMGFEKIDSEKITVAGQEFSTPSFDYDTKALLIGAQWGL